VPPCAIFAKIVQVDIADDRGGHRDGFVTVHGTELRLAGRSYHFVGANYWQAMNLASRGPGGDRQQLARELDAMCAHGITNLRIMAATEGPDTEPLRIAPALLQAPGVYNADLLDGLDFVLQALADRDMKAIMTLGNMWHWSGGFGQYLVWAGRASSIPYPPPHPAGDWDEYQRFAAEFYGNARAVSYYLDHVTKIVTRVNHYTNTSYRDDPTIMAWELANEPRALSNVDSYLAWIATTARLIKSLDRDHLVTIGSEGDTSEPSYSGTEYLRDHSLSMIDYGTAHVWAQNWGWYDPLHAVTYAPAVALAKAYIDSHVARTLTLDKPIVFEEFGLARDLGSFSPASPVTVRDRYYAEIFDHLYAIAKDHAVAGANFWAYAGESRPVPPFGQWWQPGNSLVGDPPHEQQGWYSVYNSDTSTLAIAERFSRLMSDLGLHSRGMPNVPPASPSVADLVDRMSLEEKVSLLAGADFWRTVPVPRLSIPQIKVTDGPAGARGGGPLIGGRRTAAFPVGIALGATWSTDLLHQVGELLAREVRDKGASVVLAPTLNLFRNTLNGRNFENYSEDPVLTGRLAIAFVRGVQSKGVGATPKHFVGNESEFERDTISSEIPERTLRELYLRPFEMVVKEARPWAIMTGYNRLGGTFCSEHVRLLEDILRREWGFDGLVMSDWGGTHGAVASVRAGLDLEMPGPAKVRANLIAEAERDADTSAAVRDRALQVLRLVERTGGFAAPPDVRDDAETETEYPDVRALIRRAGAEGMVLLKNAGLLPLPADARVAVVGPNAAVARVMGGGSAQINAHRQVSPLDGLRAALGSDRVEHAAGCDNDRYLPVPQTPMTIELRAAPGAEVLAVEERALGEAQWNQLPAGLSVDAFHARLSLVVSAPEDGEYELSLVSTGLSRLYLGDELVVDNWQGWRPGGVPAGLGSQEARSKRHLRAGPIELVAEYGPRVFAKGVAPLQAIRIGFGKPLPPSAVAEAAGVAAAADYAIVCIGTTAEWETEGEDRWGLDLPGRQDELVHAVARANPRTIVVLQTGGPVSMPWLDAVPAVMQAWFPGQEAGHAIADVLLGKAEPGGRLPQTFPRSLEDDPTRPLTRDVQYPGAGGKVEYREALFTGYRHVDRAGTQPLFPFGFGLGYASFELLDLAAPASLQPGETLSVTVTVKNTSARAGSTVVQAYVSDRVASLERPDKELKAFAKVYLDAGQAQSVQLTLDMRSLAYFDDARQAWVAEAGEFELLVGQSSADLPLRTRFALAAPWTESTRSTGPEMPPRRNK
jgi:beta-glucosidase